jgi:hypothetical protein
LGLKKDVAEFLTTEIRRGGKQSLEKTTGAYSPSP